MTLSFESGGLVDSHGSPAMFFAFLLLDPECANSSPIALKELCTHEGIILSFLLDRYQDHPIPNAQIVIGTVTAQ